MTDDDSDDRMERANRIREMREGRRRGPDESSADESPATDADGEANEKATPDSPDEPSDRTGDRTEDPTADPSPDTGGAADDSQAEPTDEPSEGPADDTSDAPASEQTPDEGETATDAEIGQAEDGGDPGESAGEPSASEGGFEFDTGSGPTGTAADEEASADNGAERSPRQEAAAVLAEAGVAESVTDGEAATAVDRFRESERFSIPDQATTVTEAEQGATGEGADSIAAARADAGDTAYTGEHTRVLEFALGDERFCLDIDYIEEIVELENVTRVPNSPSYVEGVVDLRGQVTAIINPKDTLDVENDGHGDLVVVFDSAEFEEQGHLGWVVDEVRQVTPVSDDEVNDSPDEDEEYVNGIINRDDEDGFIVWTTPDIALNS